MNRFNILRNIMVVIAIFLTSMQVAAEVKFLVVNLNDGSTASFALADDPVITNTTSELQVTTTENSIKVAFADLKNYQFTSELAGISEEVMPDETYRVNCNVVYINGVKPETVVRAFSLDGKYVAEVKADEDGHATIDLSAFSSGVYMISYNNKGIKILIP